MIFIPENRQKIDNLPDVPFPPEIGNAAEYFVSLVEAGVRYRYGNPSSAVKQRIQHEVDVILSAHFEKYFLIWWKIAAICRENEVLYFCASDANSSIICYVLEITDIDPLEHNLLFECFIFEYFISEITFCISKNIIQYLRDNFGSECISIHYIEEHNCAEIIIKKRDVDEKDNSFCFSFIMPGENDSDWSKFSLISSRSFHAISYSDPKIIEQIKKDREEIYSTCHLKKLLRKININSFSDLLIMEAISYFDDDVAY